MTDQEKDKLWNEYCIKGNEHNPTDTMYYEGFMEAIDKTNKYITDTEKQKIREEYLSKYYDNEFDSGALEMPDPDLQADYWLSILDKTIKSKLESVEGDLEKEIEFPNGKMDGAWVYIVNINEILNKLK